ncbi:tetratricopeptide repeat protein [Parendozoicomonas haliclonae]|uniref:Tetratricopeptide repeat protein n=1 Tax=Parendozoicomonas haliclonae TaxID=1960125 RepID=A0A1X7ANR2_9GAMM|nr:tetratricopeptide repeat protein [Parendozoicomonas haliclonae]SMA49926.1 Tetratricopeptide repeat protein [Parendozoicomonas haliclonae]
MPPESAFRKKTYRLRAAILSLAVPALLTTVIPYPVQAQAPAAKTEVRQTPAIRNKVYEHLSAAQLAAENSQYAEALATLDALLARSGKKALNSYERANTYNLYAFVHYAQDQPEKALTAYQNVVQQANIPLALEASTRYTIAQLLMSMDRWQQGIDELNRWFQLTDTASASAHVLRGQAYYQVQNYPNARQDLETAIRLYKQKGKQPKEHWLSLLRYLYQEQGLIPETIATLEELLTLYPKKDYWLQLSYIYGETGNEKKQLAALESVYVQGLLERESELVNLAYLYLNADTPAKSATLLESALQSQRVQPTSRNLELLASAWQQAREIDKALPYMIQAAEKSETGELWVRVGNLYLDKEQFKDAIAALNKGLNRGRVKRSDNANLALGIAYFQTQAFDKARKAFLQAHKDKRSQKAASQWLAFMDKEMARLQALTL